ncbi:unnamed protein product [marine sediment metagenome]|uniref:Periplasmic copper-binding protein NosD beta helix domain-containing protein n=1 Tax=marine sediment metagenome TaxID=412755 RepID=X1T6T0_9ZZZZ
MYQYSGSSDPEYNLIYNNFFNNSGTYGNIRIDTGIANLNYFNTTINCSIGLNILDDPCRRINIMISIFM